MKHRRMKQAADVLRLEKETAEKLAAKAFAKSYLIDLVPSVFNSLRENGYFYDPVERDVETGFMPWIMDETVVELDKQAVARLLLDNLIREVVVKRHADYSKTGEQLTSNNDEQNKTDESNLNLAVAETTDAVMNNNNQENEENQNEQGENVDADVEVDVSAADADTKQSTQQEEV